MRRCTTSLLAAVACFLLGAGATKVWRAAAGAPPRLWLVQTVAGEHLVTYRYVADDGTEVFHRVVGDSYPEALPRLTDLAQACRQNWGRRATLGSKRDGAGRIVGERLVVEAPAGRQPRAEVYWTDRRGWHWVWSESLAHALAAEALSTQQP